jgi:hypothetical protein
MMLAQIHAPRSGLDGSAVVARQIIRRSRMMKRILALAALCLALAGCVYGGPGPNSGYYGGSYGWGASGYPGPPAGERAASPG